MTTEAAEAVEALAAMHASQARLARAASCPPERHLAFAALMTAYISAPAAPFALMLGIEALLLACVPLIILWDKRRTGMFINGYRPGRTRPVIAVLLAGMLSLYMLGYVAARMHGLTWVPLALAPVGAVVGYFGSVWWQRIYARELVAA